MLCYLPEPFRDGHEACILTVWLSKSDEEEQEFAGMVGSLRHLHKVGKSMSLLQVLTTRARKDVKVADIKVQVCLFAFDCLSLNGKTLLEQPLVDRRNALYSALTPEPGKLQFALAKVCHKPSDLPNASPPKYAVVGMYTLRQCWQYTPYHTVRHIAMVQCVNMSCGYLPAASGMWQGLCNGL